MSWLLLFIAGVFEILWAVGLKQSHGFTRLGPSALTLTAMVASFYFLAQALKGIPLGTAYAVWTGIGAVGTAILWILLFGEDRTLARLACLSLIIAGIVGLRLLRGAE
ncbi:MAG: quaternary ammonium compound efflux SMR transporter SugE [Bryobacteraceae bacterium]